jgi:hypothetical protein
MDKVWMSHLFYCIIIRTFRLTYFVQHLLPTWIIDSTSSGPSVKLVTIFTVYVKLTCLKFVECHRVCRWQHLAERNWLLLCEPSSCQLTMLWSWTRLLQYPWPWGMIIKALLLPWRKCRWPSPLFTRMAWKSAVSSYVLWAYTVWCVNKHVL